MTPVGPALAISTAAAGGARRRRDPRVFDADGREVLITQVCTKCGSSKPLTAFGLRHMPDGKVRSIPQCRTCRSGRKGAPCPTA